MSLVKQTDVIRELFVSQLLFVENRETEKVEGGDCMSEEAMWKLPWRSLQCNKIKPLCGLYCNHGMSRKKRPYV